MSDTPKQFQGWISFGCGKHQTGTLGRDTYNIDCLDCQRQPVLAKFNGDLAISLLDVAEKALESLIPLAENGGTFGQMCNSCRRNSYEFGVHSADCDVVKAKAVLSQLRAARDQQSKKE